MPYHSPHKFRHGHAVYALKNAKDVSALKAISQNLMHSNLSITDGIYGILSKSDVRQEIASIGKDIISKKDDREKLVVLLEEVLKNLGDDLPEKSLAR